MSPNFASFLKGILTKDPKKRLGWPHLLNHPFVKEGVHIIGSKSDQPLTEIMSEEQMKVQIKINSNEKLLKRSPFCKIDFLMFYHEIISKLNFQSFYSKRRTSISNIIG